jgi:hypothetical protein
MLVVLAIMTGLYLGLVLTRLVLNPTAFRFPDVNIWVALDRQRRSLPDIVLGSRVIYLRHATVPKP